MKPVHAFFGFLLLSSALPAFADQRIAEFKDALPQYCVDEGPIVRCSWLKLVSAGELQSFASFGQSIEVVFGSESDANYVNLSVTCGNLSLYNFNNNGGHHFRKYTASIAALSRCGAGELNIIATWNGASVDLSGIRSSVILSSVEGNPTESNPPTSENEATCDGIRKLGERFNKVVDTNTVNCYAQTRDAYDICTVNDSRELQIIHVEGQWKKGRYLRGSGCGPQPGIH